MAREPVIQSGDWDGIVARMWARSIAFEAGLTDTEVASAESRFQFRFPVDLRAFLQTALPQGRQFPDWRSADEAVLREWLDLPRWGVLFDIEYNDFWLHEWGPKPASLAEAKHVVEQLIAAAPRLIPVYMHRMMPDRPCDAGNPVFSVHQTDIIVYGVDLRDYLAHEFFMSEDEQEEWTVPEESRRIEFWDTDQFRDVRWAKGSCVFDNSRGQLP